MATRLLRAAAADCRTASEGEERSPTSLGSTSASSKACIRFQSRLKRGLTDLRNCGRLYSHEPKYSGKRRGGRRGGLHSMPRESVQYASQVLLL